MDIYRSLFQCNSICRQHHHYGNRNNNHPLGRFYTNILRKPHSLNSLQIQSSPFQPATTLSLFLSSFLFHLFILIFSIISVKEIQTVTGNARLRRVSAFCIAAKLHP
jgi:hypothetical protein